MYAKDVFSINYDKLKKDGVKILLFDLDNTIRDINHTIKELKQYDTRDDILKLFANLKKDFRIFIMSNNASADKVKFYATYYKVEAITGARKPFHVGFKKAVREANNKKDLCLIGDQMLTDVLGAKTFGIKVVLVDRLGKKDALFTLFNRFIERIIMIRYNKLNIFKKGKYYG